MVNASRGASGADLHWKSAVLDPWRSRRAWLLDRQIAIAEIAAPTGHESARAASLQQELRAAGCTAFRTDHVGNLIVRVEPAGRVRDPSPVVCMAHLDTVFAHDAPLRAMRRGSAVYCPGIGDNSRGLAAMLALAHTLHTREVAERMQRAVEIVATVGEEGEGNLRGARAYFDALPADRRTFAAIAVDGPGDSGIVHHAVGSHRLRILVCGHGGHSWANAGTPNPAYALGVLIAGIARLAERERPYAAVTVSRMGGGQTLTSIPREAWLDVDIRAIESDRISVLTSQILRLAHRAAADESRPRPALALHVRTELLGDRPGGALDGEHPLVRLAAQATERVGRVPYAASASTDANVPLALGIPAIAVGAGGTGGDAHTLGEWFDDHDSERGLVRLLDLVTTLACALESDELPV